jgi:integration host factor subunit alpha
LTRAEIAKTLQERLSLSRKDGAAILESFLDLVMDCLAEGKALSILKLGRFEVRIAAPRPGRNPHTGEATLVPSRARPCFYMSGALRERARRVRERLGARSPLEPPTGEEGE